MQCKCCYSLANFGELLKVPFFSDLEAPACTFVIGKLALIFNALDF